MKRALVLAAFVLAVLAPGAALARSTKTVIYSYDSVWPAAVRFLRVDENVKILEKDAEAGFLKFELIDDKKKFKAALELVRVDERGLPATRLVLRIEARPEYMEDAMLERFAQKLKVDLGEQPTPPEPPSDEPSSSKN